ncbi:Probable inactive receptor kinase At2g26730 [Linum perenne]
MSQNDSSKFSSFLVLFLMFDLAGLIAVILLFTLYCNKARKLEKLSQSERGGTTPNSSNYVSESGTAVVEISDRRNIEDKLQVGYPTAPPPMRFGGGGEEEKLVFLQGSKMALFGLNELLKASAEGMGKGSIGNTYKAKMMEGKIIVVAKRLRDLRPLSMEDLRKQLLFLGGLRHPNLLTPLAYYVSRDEKLLVSMFVENGSLFDRIHGRRGSNDRIPFRWSARLAVARGVARGLAHLHRNTTIGIPHGNLKSSNVLLDQNDEPLVADYGFIPLIAVPIAVQRMVCYRSPEYHSHKKVSIKTDVWSYGCLLLEILTGRVSTYSASTEITGSGVNLCSWVNRAVREEWTCEVLDVEIGAQRSGIPGMLKLLQLAMRCCDKSPEKRPEIDEVVREVEGVKVVMESEDEEDLSMDQSLEDESF